MTDGIVHRITSIEPRTGYRLRVTWASGDPSIVDFADDIARGGIWAALRDNAKFAQAKVGYGGRVLAWPEPAGPDGAPRIDMDADGLYEMAARQKDTSRLSKLVPAGRGDDRVA
jgi:hypothetical protein